MDMAAPFGATWGTLIERCEDLPEDATLITPLSTKRFRVTDVQQQRVIIEDTDTSDSQPLQREQFEALVEHTRDSAGDGYDLERLPPKAEPYAAVLALHPRYVLDQEEGRIIGLEEAGENAVLDETPHLSITADDEESDERAEPDVSVYADALLLIDALEREDPTDLDTIDTPELVNLYTLLSDVQRNANDLRKDVTDVLLDRVQHDRPAHGQYGSVQRTTRRNRSLKDDEEVLNAFAETGIDREQLLGVDRGKVEEALDVVSVSEGDVYDVSESEYVRKAEVDEERKETRLQGLKDRLAVSDDPEADVLRQEVERLEQEIEELTEFSPASSFETEAESG
jgi:polyhydroxyalkanoate synthesis regulator phasin